MELRTVLTADRRRRIRGHTLEQSVARVTRVLDELAVDVREFLDGLCLALCELEQLPEHVLRKQGHLSIVRRRHGLGDDKSGHIENLSAGRHFHDFPPTCHPPHALLCRTGVLRSKASGGPAGYELVGPTRAALRLAPVCKRYVSNTCG